MTYMISVIVYLSGFDFLFLPILTLSLCQFSKLLTGNGPIWFFLPIHIIGFFNWLLFPCWWACRCFGTNCLQYFSYNKLRILSLEITHQYWLYNCYFCMGSLMSPWLKMTRMRMKRMMMMTRMMKKLMVSSFWMPFLCLCFLFLLFLYSFFLLMFVGLVSCTRAHIRELTIFYHNLEWFKIKSCNLEGIACCSAIFYFKRGMYRILIVTLCACSLSLKWVGDTLTLLVALIW